MKVPRPDAPGVDSPQQDSAPAPALPEPSLNADKGPWLPPPPALPPAPGGVDGFFPSVASLTIAPLTPPQIMRLTDQDLASAGVEQRAQMIKSLASESTWMLDLIAPTLGVQEHLAGGEAILRILRTAPDAVTLGRLYYGAGPELIASRLSAEQKSGLRQLLASFAARPGDWIGYRAFLRGVTGSEGSANHLQFLIDGPQTVPIAATALKDAKQSISVDVYQWEPDAIGWKAARALARKADAGLDVRVLIDENGTLSSGGRKAKELIEFLRAHRIQVLAHPTGLTRDHLDHRKLLVIDGKVGFAGGMNVGEHYQVSWHDQTTRLEGPAVAALQRAFVERWTAAGGSIPTPRLRALFPQLTDVANGAETFVVTHIGAQDQNIKAAYMRAIETAQSVIRVATPYFTDPDLAEALCVAARRHVRVQLIIPRDNDISLMLGAARTLYPKLLRAGVEVFEYKGRMAHQKVATVDGIFSTFGSSNLDARSMRNNDELNCVVLDKRVAADIDTRLFDVDLKSSVRILQLDPSWGELLEGSLSDWL